MSDAAVVRILVAAARPIVVNNNTKTDYWVVAIAAASALIAAIIGAAVAGRINWNLNKREWQQRNEADNANWTRQLDVQREQWLRERRATIYVGVLSELHDWVNDTAVAQGEANNTEPIGPPIGRNRSVHSRMGDLYSDLYRHATAASREDGQKVLRFKPFWDEIDATASEWTERKGAMGNDLWPTLVGPYHDRSLSAWNEANRVLAEYNDFLKDYLGGE